MNREDECLENYSMPMIVAERKYGLSLTVPEILAVITYLIGIVIGFYIKREFISSYFFYATDMTLGLLFILLSEKKNQKKYFVFGMLILSIPMAFRGYMGIDDKVYKLLFSYAERYNLIEYIKVCGNEFGFSIINYISYYLFFGKYCIFQIFITLFSFLFWGAAIWNNRDKCSSTLSCLLLMCNFYFMMMPLGLIRMFLATGIVFWSYRYLVNKKTLTFILIILFASTIHVSSLLMLILLATNFNKEFFYKHWKSLTILLCIVVLTGLIVTMKYLVPNMGTKYLNYNNTTKFSIKSSITFIPIIIFGFIIGSKKRIRDDRFYRFGMVLMFLSFFIKIITTVIPMVRLVYYTNLGMIMVLPLNAIYRHSNSKSYFTFNTFIPALVVTYSLLYVFHSSFTYPGFQEFLFPYISLFNV